MWWYRIIFSTIFFVQSQVFELRNELKSYCLLCYRHFGERRSKAGRKRSNICRWNFTSPDCLKQENDNMVDSIRLLIWFMPAAMRPLRYWFVAAAIGTGYSGRPALMDATLIDRCWRICTWWWNLVRVHSILLFSVPNNSRLDSSSTERACDVGAFVIMSANKDM